MIVHVASVLYTFCVCLLVHMLLSVVPFGCGGFANVRELEIHFLINCTNTTIQTIYSCKYINGKKLKDQK